MDTNSLIRIPFFDVEYMEVGIVCQEGKKRLNCCINMLLTWKIICEFIILIFPNNYSSSLFHHVITQ